jgi:hypothetical protein
MKKTALQELIERLKLWQHNTKNQDINYAFRECQIVATELLEKERESQKHKIIMAFEHGRSEAYNDNGNGSKDGETYYNETFKPKQIR